ncbi:pirin family protein [Methylophaga sp. OBS1]|uniref:pirin family protein n=1 Tax=Methylophaga sp. OBS1 TaxID=2991933 RepID=UPI002258ACF5|nr:pirin family protein [Methylophaga sp. OBS1]MCX4191467.1 pirin family protein [Methylophaga sp. OBS1]MCX4191588.1 pirin family protein [Methylophaga sp. OBS1]
MSIRELRQIVNGIPVSDGAGVQLKRVIGSPQLNMLDPFLMFDAFGSDRPQEYLAGFPPHPHRGFETVTYMLAGKMRHEDNAGNQGVIETGGVQWMTAGRGIIHSEMPEQEAGLLAGFQLWVNLPAAEKMREPRYQERSAAEIPVETLENGGEIKVVAGQTDQGTRGVIDNAYVKPLYLHVTLPAGSHFVQQVPETDNSFVYVIEGQLSVGDHQRPLNQGQLGVLEKGQTVSLLAETQSQFLLVSGQPLKEPVARGGPFVMNTREQLEQAFDDYREGRFA